jgi:hypothetical protein
MMFLAYIKIRYKKYFQPYFQPLDLKLDYKILLISSRKIFRSDNYFLIHRVSDHYLDF